MDYIRTELYSSFINATDFTVTSGKAPFTVTPGNTHDIEVTFLPSTLGIVNKSLTFIHNATTSPDILRVRGEGFRGLPFTEDFEGTAKGQLPTDWTVTRDSGSTTTATETWQVGGSGKYVTADAYHFVSFYYKDYLTSPKIDCSTYSTGTVTLEFDGNFKTIMTNEVTRVEIYDGADWQILEDWNVSWTDTGEHQSYNITQYALGNADMKIRYQINATSIIM